MILVFLLMAVAIAFSALPSHAVSAPAASGQINSSNGAVLRKSASVNSKKLTVLKDNAALTIHKEVFVAKKSTSSTKRWWYVTAGGKKGYVRADLVDNVRYGSVQGKVKYKCNYRKGAGTKMSKAGSFKKGS